MNSGLIVSLLASLLLTVVTELAAAWLLKVRKPSELVFVILANCITNPVVNACFYLLLSETSEMAVTVLGLLFLEIAVAATEYVYFRITLKQNRVNKLLLSVVLNTSSFLSGLIVSIVLLLVI